MPCFSVADERTELLCAGWQGRPPLLNYGQRRADRSCWRPAKPPPRPLRKRLIRCRSLRPRVRGYRVVECEHECNLTPLQAEGEALDRSTFALLGLSWAKLLWHAGFVALPVALFWVGSARYDALHAPYLLLLATCSAWPGLGLVPSPRMALVPHRQVRPVVCRAVVFEAKAHCAGLR